MFVSVYFSFWGWARLLVRSFSLLPAFLDYLWVAFEKRQPSKGWHRKPEALQEACLTIESLH